MAIDTVDIFGSDQVGIHLASVGNILFHPPELPSPDLEKITQTLGLETCAIYIGGSNLVGALLSGNSRGIAVADIVPEMRSSEQNEDLAQSLKNVPGLDHLDIDLLRELGPHVSLKRFAMECLVTQYATKPDAIHVLLEGTSHTSVWLLLLV